MKRLFVHVDGVVQGVGFRPFVYRLAREHGLTGWVKNTAQGVDLEVQGREAGLNAFIDSLRHKPPPLSQVKSLRRVDQDIRTGEKGFTVLESSPQGRTTVLISPDITICPDCLRELFDAGHRKHLYPFINCTNCGPRYSIIRALPYDRVHTSMAAFSMCPPCQAEYDDPGDRRFHAQPNGCARCGPRLGLVKNTQADPLPHTISLLKQGRIVAIKGIGGFHIACRADLTEPVKRLRANKRRRQKPFALMVPDLDHARRIARLTQQDITLLRHRAAPIVLVKKHPDCPLSPLIAPNLDTIGLMLPYTPLHHLLFRLGLPPGQAHFSALVMTSANRRGRPLIKEEQALLEAFGDECADILGHDRAIVNRIDDSVIAADSAGPFFIRRSRGFAPLPLALPQAGKATLCLGAEKTNTIAVTQGRHAFLSGYIGDVKTLETFDYMRETASTLQRLYAVDFTQVACDMHPRYETSRWAGSLGLPVLKVQHHHAHIASVLGEREYPGPVIGIAFDGTGYGTDATGWGGEILCADTRAFTREGFLSPLALPGGDRAVKEPYRIALACLHHLYGKQALAKDLPLFTTCEGPGLRVLMDMLEKGLHTVQATSAGRLFDAVSSLLGLCRVISYQGQAAMELEAAAHSARPPFRSYPFHLTGGTPFEINTWPMVAAIVEDVEAGRAIPAIAADFHRTLARMVTAACLRVRDTRAMDRVALSGGVLQNRLLRDLARQDLTEAGFTVWFNQVVPPGDGGIAYGQAVVAVCREARD